VTPPGTGTTSVGRRSRLDELRDSASVLGMARVVHLGYADSGHGPVLFPDPPGRTRFARADISEAAAKLAALLRDERADLLVSYDQNGGYGHRDHVRVHQVGARAAGLAGTPRVVEATLPREPFVWLWRAVLPLRLIVRHDVQDPAAVYTPWSAITHRVDVRAYAPQKRAALAAHASQIWPNRVGRSGRVFWLLTRLPLPLFRLLLGREWFTESQSAPGPRQTHLL
jgi:LmbE family N-acetylglucosaminyl deacetylase